MSIAGTPYTFDLSQISTIKEISSRVESMRKNGDLTPEVLHTIRKYFKIKNIYHSNAIEGNSLNVGETRTVVEQGLTLTGKSLHDQAEAKNLSHALDYLEELATSIDRPITEHDIRAIHELVLRDINDAAGSYRSVHVEISGSEFKPTQPESIASDMANFGKWLQKASMPGELFTQSEAILAASAAHTWLVTTHLFIDGNGRVARLLMNLLLMRFGFPVAIITREDRSR